LSHREVAERLGLTEQATRQAYVRAKRALISFFENGVDGLTSKRGNYVTN